MPGKKTTTTTTTVTGRNEMWQICNSQRSTISSSETQMDPQNSEPVLITAEVCGLTG